MDEDYYYLISRFYEVDLTINDFLNIISRVNGVCYNKIELLKKSLWESTLNKWMLFSASFKIK